jgi:quercetin 2,3-dioxygenase
MFEIRKSADRGHANHGWLDSYHTFSFAEYYDEAHMHFSVLRVINEDVIAPSAGFGMHGHRDMEIITYMLSGELRHQDSMGNGAVIKAGDVQRMTAGTGVRHSEVNASSETPAHLLQIWLLPHRNGLPPSYEDKHIPLAKKLNQWALIASPDAREESLKIHQDVLLWASVLQSQHALSYSVAAARCLYLQVALGAITVNGETLVAGDAVKLCALPVVELLAQQDSEIVMFDLPNFNH